MRKIKILVLTKTKLFKKGIQEKIKKLTLYGIRNKKIQNKIPLNVNINIINDLSLMYKPSSNIKSSLIENVFEEIVCTIVKLKSMKLQIKKILS